MEVLAVDEDAQPVEGGYAAARGADPERGESQISEAGELRLGVEGLGATAVDDPSVSRRTAVAVGRSGMSKEEVSNVRAWAKDHGFSGF